MLGPAEEKRAPPAFKGGGASSLTQVWQVCGTRTAVSAFKPMADIIRQSRPSLLQRSNVTSHPFSTQAATTTK